MGYVLETFKYQEKWMIKKIKRKEKVNKLFLFIILYYFNIFKYVLKIIFIFNILFLIILYICIIIS